MFDTLLVANRGEIACRIIRSADALGLRTVAVYSDADRGAPHVGMADAAVRLGPAPARESYLRADAVLEAAAATRGRRGPPRLRAALRERARSREAVEAAGLAFVGPTPEQLRAFGAKDASRELARAAGVPLLAGTGLLHDLDGARSRRREEIGYPVMLKATAGAAGSGWSAVTTTADAARPRSTRVRRVAGRELRRRRGVPRALRAPAPRHVEVQVFGDGAGARRRPRRPRLHAAAPPPEGARGGAGSGPARCASASGCTLGRRARARRCDYRSAGTVEFIYDAEREEASFLEVNARLQVEHPVTEARYRRRPRRRDAAPRPGRRAASSTSWPRRSRRAAPCEARLYAEDPGADHRPSAGAGHRGRGCPGGLRVDGWVAAGTEVTHRLRPAAGQAHRPRRHARGGARRASPPGWRRPGSAASRPTPGCCAPPSPTRACARRRTRRRRCRPSPIPSRGSRCCAAATMTTVQDWPGRRRLWDVGVPPSGAMDDRSLRLGNRALGNAEGAPGARVHARRARAALQPRDDGVRDRRAERR